MSDRRESIGILNHCIKDNCSGCSNHFSDGRATCESYRYDTNFFTHIIAEICNYAIDNDMAPDDELSTIANNIKKLLEISSFNAWIREGEKLKTGRCHKNDEAEMINREKVVEGLEKCERCECDDCTENGASHFPWDCPAYDNFIENAITLLKEQEPVEAIDIIDEKYPVGDNNRYKGYRCGKCKEVIPWDANYCSYCGRKVKWDD